MQQRGDDLPVPLVPGIHSKELILSLPLKALCQSSPQILVPQASFVVFIPEKICMWDRGGIAFPSVSSQLKAELCLPGVIGTGRLFPQGGRVQCLGSS